jgi:hypothetical protein
MPWDISKVEEHKSGLSDSQKKKWVEIANSVLKSCKAKGGKDCDAMAIRVANSRVGANSLQSNFTSQDYVPRVVNWNNESFYVVPVIMMVEGVHNGSHGPIFHSINELGKITGAWNGIPVTIGHPFDEYGEFVSANSPEILDEWSVGKIFNTFVEDEKLKAEAWLNIEKLKKVSYETFQAIQLGKILEVSVGIFSDEDYQEGDWNEEHYIAVAKNHRPDHLALLPGEIGACSIDDGCGVRVNSENVVTATVTITDSDGNENTVYIDMPVDETIIENAKKGGATMCAPCKEKVNELIAHESTLFTDDDREWLEALTEDKLDKLIPKVITVQTEVKIPPTVDEAWEIVLKDIENTLDDFVAHVPEQAKVQINSEFKEKEERQNVVENLITNSDWKEEELDKMPLSVLKKLESSLNKEGTDFSINGMRSRGGESSKVRPLPLPGVKFN